MSAFLIAVTIVGTFALLMFLIARASDSDNPMPWGVGIAALLVVVFWVFISAAQADEDKGPCLRYETRMMSTGKTVMPYRVCVERGEWVK